MATNLDAAVTETMQEPPDHQRLTAAAVFIHHAKLGKCLEQVVELYKKIPDTDQRGLTDDLNQMRKCLGAALLVIDRLIEANR